MSQDDSDAAVFGPCLPRSFIDDFSDFYDVGDKDNAAAAAAAPAAAATHASPREKRKRADRHQLRERRERRERLGRRAKTDALRQLAAEGEPSDDDGRSVKRANRWTASFDDPVKTMFAKLIKERRVLYTGLFSSESTSMRLCTLITSTPSTEMAKFSLRGCIISSIASAISVMMHKHLCRSSNVVLVVLTMTQASDATCKKVI